MTTSFSKLTHWCKFLARTLWLSVSSADFYSDVHSKYRGYGIRYILSLYLISGLIFSIWSFDQLIELENKMSPANPDVEHVLRQIPDMYYDGLRLTTKVELPIFIYDKDNRKIAAIDLNQELNAGDKNKLFMVFNDNYVQLPVKIGMTKGGNTNAEYKYIFGSEPTVVNHETIVAFLPKLWRSINKAYIYLLTPLVGLIYFAAMLLYNIPYAIFVWLISYFWDGMSRSSGVARQGSSLQVFDLQGKSITSLQAAYRMTLFASGASVFLQPISIIISPNLAPIVAGVSLASWVFMIMGIVKLKRR